MEEITNEKQELREKFLIIIKERIENLQRNIVKFSEWEKFYDDASQMIISSLFTTPEKLEYIESLINANVMCTTKQEKVDFIMMGVILKNMKELLSKTPTRIRKR